MTPQSPREHLLRLGLLLQSIASHREGGGAPDVGGAILWESDLEGRIRSSHPIAVHPEDRERARAAFLGALARREPFAIDYRLRRGDGAWRWAMDSGRPRLGADGELLGYVGSVLDVHELSQAEEARRESENRLQDFIATLSHELRNPLAPLRNALQLLRLGERRDGATAPVHEMMERQVEHLVRLVDDLLEMSRITRGALELRREAVELAAVVRNAVETSRPLIDAAAHRLELALPEAPLPAHGDPVRLTQILANLLNNAARYTPRGGTIALRLERRADAAEISVRDSGRGIAPEMLPRLFGMFARGEGSTGLGIGLALARRLAEMHGGAIEARSEGIGKGAEFVVRLPLGAPGEQKSIPEPKEGRRLPRQRILVVDDNRDAADSLGMLLGFLGAEVEIANDGEAALAAFARARPAAVLLDLGMPGMDGYEVARRLRAAGADGVPIIALTGWGQEQDRRRVREAGFDKHLIKPADMGTLRALLASLS
jgi:signal transduction histidine kinase